MNEALLPATEILFSFLAQKAHFDCRYVVGVKDCVFCNHLFKRVVSSHPSILLYFTFVVYIVGMDSEREGALCLFVRRQPLSFPYSFVRSFTQLTKGRHTCSFRLLSGSQTECHYRGP